MGGLAKRSPIDLLRCVINGLGRGRERVGYDGCGGDGDWFGLRGFASLPFEAGGLRAAVLVIQLEQVAAEARFGAAEFISKEFSPAIQAWA